MKARGEAIVSAEHPRQTTVLFGHDQAEHALLDAYRSGIGPMLLQPAWDGVDDPIERIFALLRRYRVEGGALAPV